MVARERSKPRRRTGTLIFGVGGGQGKVKTLKTSSYARLRGWWWPDKGRNSEDEHDTRLRGWWWQEKSRNPEDERNWLVFRAGSGECPPLLETQDRGHVWAEQALRLAFQAREGGG